MQTITTKTKNHLRLSLSKGRMMPFTLSLCGYINIACFNSAFRQTKLSYYKESPLYYTAPRDAIRVKRLASS